MKGIRCFLWGELLLCGASLAGVAYRVRENYQGLSFGGFMGLFLLLLLFPCFLALAGCIPLHLRTLKTGRPFFSLIASLLQGLAPVLWLWLLTAFGYKLWTPDLAAYWCEWAMMAGMLAGGLGFVLCLAWLVAECVKKGKGKNYEAV